MEITSSIGGRAHGHSSAFVVQAVSGRVVLVRRGAARHRTAKDVQDAKQALGAKVVKVNGLPIARCAIA
jgi:uncharacterized Zn-binding protein involved in type VI secretion